MNKYTVIYRKYYYTFSVYLAKFIFWVTGGYTVEGKYNVPKKGAAIIACNHISLVDPVAMLIGAPRPLSFMAASELHQIPLFGSLIRFMGAFSVKRGQHDKEAINTAKNLLSEGEGVVMYPEGKLSQDSTLQELHPGAVLLAIKAKCPIVPAVVTGTDKMLPFGEKFIKRSYKSIRYGKPIMVKDFPEDMSVKEKVAKGSAMLRQALLDLGAKPGKTDLNN